MYWLQRPISEWCSPRAMPNAIAISLALLLCALSSGCGGPGSGSSGLSERAAIARSQTTRECASADSGVTFCPTNEEGVSLGGESIDTPSVDDVIVECFLFDEIDVLCLFTLTYQPNGFATTPAFVMATRPFDSDETWQVGPANDVFFIKDEDGNKVPIVLGEAFFSAPDLEQTSVQLAIVLLDDAEAELPETVVTLDELGTELAFASPEFESVLVRIPAENDAIDLSLSDQTCVDAGVTFYCPADKTFQASQFELQFGVPLFFFETLVGLSLDEQQPLRCFPSGRKRCAFEVELRVIGAIESFYQSGARVIPPEGDPVGWRVGEEIFDPTEDPEGERILMLPIEVDLRDVDLTPDLDGKIRLPVQIAVMPDPIPITRKGFVEELFDYVGFYTFIAEPVEIEVVVD
jgi:hypothetical protein